MCYCVRVWVLTMPSSYGLPKGPLLFPCFLPSLSALLERMQKNWSPALWHSFLLWRGFKPHGGRSHSGGIKCPTLVSPNRAHNWQRVRLSWTFACSALCNLWCYMLKLHALNAQGPMQQMGPQKRAGFSENFIQEVETSSVLITSELKRFILYF